MITILSKIRKLCAQKGIRSLAELEHSSGLAPRTVYKWDSQTPSVDKVAAVAKALGVTVDELLRKEDTKSSISLSAPAALPPR